MNLSFWGRHTLDSLAMTSLGLYGRRWNALKKLGFCLFSLSLAVSSLPEATSVGEAQGGSAGDVGGATCCDVSAPRRKGEQWFAHSIHSISSSLPGRLVASPCGHRKVVCGRAVVLLVWGNKNLCMGGRIMYLEGRLVFSLPGCTLYQIAPF